MILLLAVVSGVIAGILRARWLRTRWASPELRYLWLVPVAFLPQFFVFYFPWTRNHIPVALAAFCLVCSQLGLMLFCTLNKHLPGMPILATGLILNFLAIIANGGLMPLETTTAARLVPGDVLVTLQVGARFGMSKDILLTPEAVVFPWLADRFVPPDWFPYQFAFSLGDILVAVGVFILLAISQEQRHSSKKGRFSDDYQPII